MREMKKLIALLLGWKVVWVQWYDGRVTYNLVQPTPFGYQGYAISRVFDIGNFVCLPDGACTGASYISSWREA